MNRKPFTCAMICWVCWLLALASLAVFGRFESSAQAADAAPALALFPAEVQLTGPTARQQVIATQTTGERLIDVTREASWKSANPEIARVSDGGLVTNVSDGQTTIEVRQGVMTFILPVEVHGSAESPTVNLEDDIVPILTRFGCNSGACHGKARGQNGFELSLLGFYPDMDFATITQEARGRRIFGAAPEQSLLLRKASARVPHGGGERLTQTSHAYAQLRDWIASGTPRRAADDPLLVKVTVHPDERILEHDTQQQLVVMAHYSDGRQRDVTHLSDFQSSESAIVAVDEQGLVTAGSLPGEAAIMARFNGQISIANVLIPLEGEVAPDVYEQLPQHNFIDALVWAKLKRLRIIPSQEVDDATYMRRVYTDIIGRLPTPDEVRTFLGSTDPERRAALIDHLLEQPEYADFWANKWSDLLVPNPYRVGAKATLTYDYWIRQSFRNNIPYDEFVRQVVTAQGSTWQNGPVTLLRDRREPDELTTVVSQLFLGIRLDCARCHHHPFEKWGQEHFYSFAAYFGQLGRKGRGLSPPISGSEEIFYNKGTGEVKHPLTDEVMAPAPLFGTAPEIQPEQDPRVSLAAWMTGADNAPFAEVMANRVWGDLMGRGIVEPVDDFRATNPPTNAPLVQALGQHFREQKFDVKALIRTICGSYAYQLSSEPSERNVVDTRNYSRHYRTRLRGEVLLDALCQVTGVPEKFTAMPPDTRAVQLWTRRIGSLFLDTFGRPDPNQDPPCERFDEPNVVQPLHMMNAPALNAKITSDQGIAAKLAASDKTPEQIVEELYLATFNRYPTTEEQAAPLAHFADPETTRRVATEDLLWALINTAEFMFQN